MAGLFRLVYTAPLSIRVRSRECCTYFYRAVSFVGWTPPREGTKRYIYLAWTCLTIGLSTVYLPIGFTLSLVKNLENFTPEVFLGVLQITFNIFGETVKTIILISFLKNLRETAKVLDQLDERLQNDSDRRRIHKGVANCNYVFMTYAKLYTSYMFSVLLTGLLNGQLPWLIYNPLFDWRQGGVRFWLQSILENLLMPFAAIVNLILDTYTILFLMIFRSHVDVLKDHIRRLRTDPLQTEAEHYKDLVGCIIDHKLILHCCGLMRPVMSRTIFVQFLLIGIILGLAMLNALYFAGLYRSINSIIFFIAALLETFPFCYLCDLLVEDCAELSNLLAQSHWLAAEPRYKSTLRIFMLHLQQPILFIAGGIFTISMNSNIKMAKFAFSVMTIVREMGLTDQFT